MQQAFVIGVLKFRSSGGIRVWLVCSTALGLLGRVQKDAQDACPALALCAALPFNHQCWRKRRGKHKPLAIRRWWMRREETIFTRDDNNVFFNLFVTLVTKARDI